MIYQFQRCTLDTGRYVLVSDGREVAVEPQVFDLLVYLIEHRDRLVSRAELLERLWPGKVVTDAALSARLKAARKAVGDSGRAQHVIKTVHGRGYKFVVNVDVPQANSSRAISQDKQAAQGTHTASALPEPPSVAVLPFQNLSGDPEQTWFAQAMAREIANALTRTSDLYVVANYANYDTTREIADLKNLAQEQGIQFMLDCGVFKSGDRVRINAQLIEVETGLQKWADRYDAKLDDVFAVQDEITKNIIAALHVKLSHGLVANTWARGTHSVAAWTCVVRGFDCVDQADKTGIWESRRLAEEAIALDPEYVSAWTLLAFSYADEAHMEWSDRRAELIEKGFEAAQRGLELNPDDQGHLAALANVYMTKGDFDEAVAVAERAVRLGPDMDGLAISAFALVRTGQAEQALGRIQKAIRHATIYPPWVTLILGICYLQSGQVPLAVSTLLQSVDRVPDSPYGMPWLIVALVESGSLDEARTRARTLMQIEPEFRAGRWSQMEFKDPATARTLAKNLIRAGLPE